MVADVRGREGFREPVEDMALMQNRTDEFLIEFRYIS